MLVDDYGHHPTEVAAVIKAVRGGWPERRLVMVYQPHRYSRTRDLYDDFVNVLADANVLLLMEVYPAGEEPIPGPTAASCATASASAASSTRSTSIAAWTSRQSSSRCCAPATFCCARVPVTSVALHQNC